MWQKFQAHLEISILFAALFMRWSGWDALLRRTRTLRQSQALKREKRPQQNRTSNFPNGRQAPYLLISISNLIVASTLFPYSVAGSLVCRDEQNPLPFGKMQAMLHCRVRQHWKALDPGGKVVKLGSCLAHLLPITSRKKYAVPNTEYELALARMM